MCKRFIELFNICATCFSRDGANDGFHEVSNILFRQIDSDPIWSMYTRLINNVLGCWRADVHVCVHAETFICHRTAR